jgi:hypothetical protein
MTLDREPDKITLYRGPDNKTTLDREPDNKITLGRTRQQDNTGENQTTR